MGLQRPILAAGRAEHVRGPSTPANFAITPQVPSGTSPKGFNYDFGLRYRVSQCVMIAKVQIKDCYQFVESIVVPGIPNWSSPAGESCAVSPLHELQRCRAITVTGLPQRVLIIGNVANHQPSQSPLDLRIYLCPFRGELDSLRGKAMYPNASTVKRNLRIHRGLPGFRDFPGPYLANPICADATEPTVSGLYVHRRKVRRARRQGKGRGRLLTI